MSEKVIEDYLSETVEGFRSYKKLAERAVEQVSDEEFFRLIDAESNSIAVIVKHIGGNLRSRWTDFLTTDGEKADRNRDAEFVAETDSREAVMQIWETGWNRLFATLDALTAADLGKIVQIRGEDFTVVKAISRAALHTVSHVGQITFLAKHLRVADWKTLSVPRNQSAEFNGWLKEKEDKGNYLEATAEFAERKLKENLK